MLVGREGGFVFQKGRCSDGCSGAHGVNPVLKLDLLTNFTSALLPRTFVRPIADFGYPSRTRRFGAESLLGGRVGRRAWQWWTHNRFEALRRTWRTLRYVRMFKFQCSRVFFSRLALPAHAPSRPSHPTRAPSEFCPSPPHLKLLTPELATVRRRLRAPGAVDEAHVWSASRHRPPAHDGEVALGHLLR